jgi:serine/threonine protein kinase
MSATERIGRYDLVAHLATGGMGQVYLARSSGLGGFVRHVVIKTLDLPGTDEDEAIAMFLDEARLLGLLHHQHITPVYEVGKDDHGFFLVMDYVHGRTAHDVWRRTHELGAALPIDFSLTVAASAASGLHYAHTRRDAEGRSLRIVHRDVSLSNLMIGFDGAVKLIDFGIAKAANRQAQTQVGFIKGKVGYMAPEQLLGHEVDARSDVFALGIVLYELTTMRRAFREETDRATMERIRAGSFTAPSAINPEYPPELARIVTRALRVDPRERYPDAEAMRRDLDLLGHQLGLVLGDAAIVEVMSQLWEHRSEPWEKARPVRASTELEVPLEIVPVAAVHEEEPTDPTSKPPQHLSLRAATEVAESQLLTPPHGLPKRPSSFNIEGSAPKQTVTNDTDGVTIVPPGPLAASAPVGNDTEGVPVVPGMPAAPAVVVPIAALDVLAVGRPPVPLPQPGRGPGIARRGRAAVVGIAAALLAAAAVSGAVYVLEGSGDAQAEVRAPGGSAELRVELPPPAAPPPRVLEKRPAPPLELPIVLPPGTPIQLVVKTMPSDATILLDGKRLGRSPYIGTVAAASGLHTLKIRKKGYVPVSLDLELVNNVSREVMLQRVKSDP